MVAWRTVAWRMIMVCGVWCVVCGVWCVVCGVWCVVCGVWCGGLADGGLADDYGVWYVVYGVVAW